MRKGDIVRSLRYDEPLDLEELAFVRRREERDRQNFFSFLRILLIVCFICPFVYVWYLALFSKDPNPFRYKLYFALVGFLIVFSSFCSYLTYIFFLGKVHWDAKWKRKTIERVHVMRKLYMAQTDTYFFYIDSPSQ